MFGLDKEWAPVVSGFTGAVLTGLFGLVLLWRQNRAAKKASAAKELADAYGEFLARAFSFVRRVEAVGRLMQLRSGLVEGWESLLGRRKPLDFLDLHDWVDVDFRPLGDAWCRIHVVGSQDAIIAADELLLVSGDLMAAAIATDARRTGLARTIVGERPSTPQIKAYQALVKKFFVAREAFVVLARKELGKDAVRLPLERARQHKA